MLSKISSYLSVKEAEVSMYFWRIFFGKVGSILPPKVGKHFLFVERVMSDPEIRQIITVSAASMGLIGKRVAVWSHKVRNIFPREAWGYFNALGAQDMDDVTSTIASRIDKIDAESCNNLGDEIVKRALCKRLGLKKPIEN